MKAAIITILLILAIVLINFCRDGNFDGPLPHCLPLLGGKEPSFYDIGGIICIGIAILGLSKIRRNNKSDE